MISDKLLAKLKDPDTPLLVVGIDPSINGTALCGWIPDGGHGHAEMFRQKESNADPTIYGRINRFNGLACECADQIARWKHEASGDTDGSRTDVMCLIEGYSYGVPMRKGKDGKPKPSGGLSHIRSIAEHGFCLRYTVTGVLHPIWCEVPPPTIKKFATGKGNADKALVVSALAKRYSVEFATNDEADARACMELGRAALGLTEAPKYATKAIEVARQAMEAVEEDW